jgi:transcription initiation factor TFIIB
MLLKMKEKLSLSEAIVEKAAYIYRKALEKKLVRGRSILALIAASLYAACRESGTPRTIKEVSDAIDIRRGDLAASYRMLLQELELKMPVVDSVQCIARIASQIGLSEKTKRYAMKILKKAEQDQSSSGKDPMGLAASALYLAGLKLGEKISQKQVAVASGVTEVTIRNRCKGLKSLDV